MNAALGVASLVVGALCAVYSIAAILFGTARPHRISWCAWTIVACLGSAATFSAGAGWGSLAAARTAVTAAIIFGLSLVPRYGKPDAERRSDVVLGLIALAATIAWKVVGLPVAFAAAVAVGADVLIGLPTIREAWRQPQHESAFAWILGLVAALLGVLAIEHVTFSSAAYLVGLSAVNVCIIIALFVSRRRNLSPLPEPAVDHPAP